MTENEAKAVKYIESIKQHAVVTLHYIAKEKPNVSPLLYKGREEKANTILAMIEELQQYRAIGTVEECRKSVEICKFMIERNITPKNMHEYMKFEDECVREGFTFKSLLEAREKQKEKKIETFNGQASCPNCKHLFGGMDVIKNLIAWDMPYCKMCGQKLDWSEEE